MKFFKWFTTWRIVGILAILTLGIFLIAEFVPFNPVNVKSIITDKTSYRAGEAFTYSVDRCRNIDGSTTGTASRSLVSLTNKDALPISLGSSPTVEAARGCGVVKRDGVIPSDTPSGDYKLKIITSYNVLITRGPVVNTYYSNTFEVEN